MPPLPQFGVVLSGGYGIRPYKSRNYILRYGFSYTTTGGYCVKRLLFFHKKCDFTEKSY